MTLPADLAPLSASAIPGERVTLPGLDVTVQVAPISLAHALAAADADGVYRSHLAVPLHAFLAGQSNATAMRRYLSRALLDDPGVCDIDARPVGIEPSTGEVYLQVSLDLRG